MHRGIYLPPLLAAGLLLSLVPVPCRGAGGSSTDPFLIYSFSFPNPDQTPGIVNQNLVTGTSQTLIQGSGGNVGPAPQFFLPLGITADPANQRFYYADVNGASIRRMNFDGTGSVTIV